MQVPSDGPTCRPPVRDSSSDLSGCPAGRPRSPDDLADGARPTQDVWVADGLCFTTSFVADYQLLHRQRERALLRKAPPPSPRVAVRKSASRAYRATPPLGAAAEGREDLEEENIHSVSIRLF